MPSASSTKIPTLSPLFLDNLRSLTTSLFSALWVLKSEGVIHADIKPENIFVSTALSAYPLSQMMHHRSHSSNRSTEKYMKSEKLYRDLGADSHELKFHLGDFGNAFLLSEAMKFYREFNIQSMPYRSPEILCGIPFNHQIDMWSIGVILLEICMGRTLFSCETREELFVAQCQHLTPPNATRFAGGKYSRDLFTLVASQSLVATSFSDHLQTIYNLLITPISDRSSLTTIYPSDLLHLIASLTYPDPDLRLNIQDAIQHSFVASSIAIPMTVWNISTHKSKGRKNKNTIDALRTATIRSKSMNHNNGLSHSSSKAEMKEKYALNW